MFDVYKGCMEAYTGVSIKLWFVGQWQLWNLFTIIISAANKYQYSNFLFHNIRFLKDSSLGGIAYSFDRIYLYHYSVFVSSISSIFLWNSLCLTSYYDEIKDIHSSHHSFYVNLFLLQNEFNSSHNIAVSLYKRSIAKLVCSSLFPSWISH